MKVLIIEDDELIGLLIQEELEDHNIPSIIAPSGVEAYKLLFNTTKDFDFIIWLPDENGVEIVKFIKEKFYSKIIIYTGKSFDDYKDKCFYDYFVEKGLSVTEVTKIITDTSLV